MIYMIQWTIMVLASLDTCCEHAVLSCDCTHLQYGLAFTLRSLKLIWLYMLIGMVQFSVVHYEEW